VFVVKTRDSLLFIILDMLFFLKIHIKIVYVQQISRAKKVEQAFICVVVSTLCPINLYLIQPLCSFVFVSVVFYFYFYFVFVFLCSTEIGILEKIVRSRTVGNSEADRVDNMLELEFGRRCFVNSLDFFLLEVILSTLLFKFLLLFAEIVIGIIGKII
jgi:hypothetical protein